MSCNCIIGRLCGEEITLSSIKREVVDLLAYQARLVSNNMLDSSKQVKSFKEVVDARKGYLYRFNYCHNCGTEINWKQIIKDNE